MPQSFLAAGCARVGRHGVRSWFFAPPRPCLAICWAPLFCCGGLLPRLRGRGTRFARGARAFALLHSVARAPLAARGLRSDSSPPRSFVALGGRVSPSLRSGLPRPPRGERLSLRSPFFSATALPAGAKFPADAGTLNNKAPDFYLHFPSIARASLYTPNGVLNTKSERLMQPILLNNLK